MTHDWALTLVVPMTDKEVRNLVAGKRLRIRNPAAQMKLRNVACRRCGVGADQINEPCVLEMR